MIDREGTVETMHEEEGKTLKEALIKRGLVEDDSNNLEISVPIESHSGLSLKNLIFMLHSKQHLINKSIGKKVFKINKGLVSKLEESSVENITEFKALFEENKGDTYGIIFNEDTIVFDGFPFDPEKIKAFTELAALMSSVAVRQKRISPNETLEENEKYYMRVWLVRLGLGGQGGKETRKILLEKLKGHTAFRTEEEKEKAKEKAKLKKEQNKE